MAGTEPVLKLCGCSLSSGAYPGFAAPTRHPRVQGSSCGQEGGDRYENRSLLYSVILSSNKVLRHSYEVLSEDAVYKRLFATIALASTLLIPVSIPASGAVVQAPGINAGNKPINCRVMEVFEEGKLGVRVIIFHQRDQADGPRLGALLLANSGKEMELEAAGGRRVRAAVFRVKSCFGRGLALIPAGQLKLSEHDEFTLRLP